MIRDLWLWWDLLKGSEQSAILTGSMFCAVGLIIAVIAVIAEIMYRHR